MEAIMDIAKRRGVHVVEDCAQSWLSYYKGRLAGTIGDIGCFSTNEFKHISTGDGGALLINDEALYRRALKFSDKNYDRIGDDPAVRNCEFLAPNYRMTELQGAVGVAQLDRLEAICQRRNAIGERITREISGLSGVYPPKVYEGCKSSYWFFMMQVYEKEAGVHASEFTNALVAEGIPASYGYIPTCVYEYPLFVEKNAYPGTHAPFDSPYYGKDIAYGKGLCPNAEKILENAVKFPISEFFSDGDVDDMIAAVKKVAGYYKNK
jgi:dTDP-4-amino-4,6-dideoxygalactose transaminase